MATPTLFRISLRKAPHGRSWIHYIVGIALNAGMFAALGPLFGAVAVTGLLAIILIVPIFVAYQTSNIAAAALAGACIAILSSFIRSSAMLYAVSAPIGALSAVVLGQFEPSVSGYLVLGAAGAAAAPACAVVGRSIRLRPENFPDEAHGSEEEGGREGRTPAPQA